MWIIVFVSWQNSREFTLRCSKIDKINVCKRKDGKKELEKKLGWSIGFVKLAGVSKDDLGNWVK